MSLLDQLERDFARYLGDIKPPMRPVCPFPASVMPKQHELPEGRDDFTRESEATAV